MKTQHQPQHLPGGVGASAAAGSITFKGHTVSLTKDDLRAIQVMQDLRHGRIENAPIRNGSLVINDRSKIFQTVGKASGNHDRKQKKPWLGRRPHRRHYKWIAACRHIATGVMDWIDVADGLPVSWKLRPHGRRGKK